MRRLSFTAYDGLTEKEKREKRMTWKGGRKGGRWVSKVRSFGLDRIKKIFWLFSFFYFYLLFFLFLCSNFFFFFGGGGDCLSLRPNPRSHPLIFWVPFIPPFLPIPFFSLFFSL